MKYRNFEKNIKHILENDEMDLNVDKLINAIHDDKKRKGSPFFLRILPLLLIGISLTLWLSYNYNNHYKNNQVINNSFTFNEKNSVSNSGKNFKESKLQQNVSFDEKSVEPSKTNLLLGSEVNTYNKSIEFKTNKNSAKNREEYPIKNNYALSFDDNKNSVEIIPVSDSENSPNPKKPTLLSNENSSDLVNSNNDFSHKKVSINFLPLLTPIVKSNKKQIQISDKIICPKFERKFLSHWSLIPEIGYFLPAKNIESKNLGEPGTAFALRKDKEQSLEGLSAGLFLKYQSEKWPIYIKLGFTQSRIAEQMKTNYIDIKKDTVIGIISLTVSQTGDTITTIYGPIVKEIKTVGTRTNHYFLHLTDMPLALGIEKQMGKFIFSAEGGAILNLGLRAKGKVLVDNTSFEDASQSYKTSLGLSYFGGIGVEKPLNERISVGANLRARFMNVDFSSENNKISQSYNTYGLNLNCNIKL